MIFPFLPFMIQDFFPSLHRSELGSRAGYLGSSYYIGSFFGSLMVSSSAGTHILLHYVWPTYISMCKHLCMYVYICVCMHMCVQCVCVQYVFPHFLLFVWNFSFPKLWAQVCRLHIAGCTGVIVGYFWDISGRSPMQGLNNNQWLICHCFFMPQVFCKQMHDFCIALLHAYHRLVNIQKWIMDHTFLKSKPLCDHMQPYHYIHTVKPV